ncbi:cysteine-rich motor neuron 1 protein-like isoform X2 [Sycon ciliatum]|uniref:cysteine-rich motor neuron 1 protein-like isoform X2 n=1 Tax=Sycon ciliatum TaxID=27933 RepID=UPI0031F63BBF
MFQWFCVLLVAIAAAVHPCRSEAELGGWQQWRQPFINSLGPRAGPPGKCVTRNGRVYETGEVWRPHDCKRCMCAGGKKVCVRSNCKEPDTCSTGQHSVKVAGYCCRQCRQLVPRNCTGPNGERRQHNETWHPTDCSTCDCVDGRTRCRSSFCPTPICDEGYEAVNVEGLCCNQCVEIPAANELPVPRVVAGPADCTVPGTGGERRQHNETWHPTDCSTCHCVDGRTRCRSSFCPTPICDEGYEAVDVEGLCCDQCVDIPVANNLLVASVVSAPANCTGLDSERRQHNETWHPTDCSTCDCVDGRTGCRSSVCPTPTCDEGYEAVDVEGLCCDQCVKRGPADCVVPGTGGERRQHNETWHPTDCSTCHCVDGRTRCRSSMCPTLICDEGYEVVDVAGLCCDQCLKIRYVRPPFLP